jgi:hypothetical protein
MRTRNGITARAGATRITADRWVGRYISGRSVPMIRVWRLPSSS